MNPFLPFLLLVASGAQAYPDPAEPEQRRVVKQVFEQLMAEDGNVHHSRDHRGHDRVLIGTRARASDEDGLCRRDILSIERDPAVPVGSDGPGSIRALEVERWFYVLTDSQERPLWEVSGEALERRCARVSPSQGRWFTAPGSGEAKAAVIAMSALKAELLKPQASREVWVCRIGRKCPDARKIGELIEPLDPGSVTSGDDASLRCPDDRRCLGVQLQDPVCGGWVTQIRMDRTDNERFRSAHPTWLAGLLECGEREMNEMEAGPLP